MGLRWGEKGQCFARFAGWNAAIHPHGWAAKQKNGRAEERKTVCGAASQWFGRRLGGGAGRPLSDGNRAGIGWLGGRAVFPIWEAGGPVQAVGFVRRPRSGRRARVVRCRGMYMKFLVG